MRKNPTYNKAASSAPLGLLVDLLALSKAKLSALVVFTSVMGYAIVAGSAFDLVHAVILVTGGFLTTAAANTLNQVLEKDYDAIMTRTKVRPLPAGRMTSSAAVIFAGLSCLVGIVILATFNPLTALLGMLSLIVYAFVYTPLKRYSPIAVAVGAVPGALPVLIGATSFSGTLTAVAVMLFCLQFCWQFPHFWSIGYLGFQDYRAAGYKLMPTVDEEIDPKLGWNAMIYALILIPLVGIGFQVGFSLLSSVLALALAVFYMFYTYRFATVPSRLTARGAMFASFAYLPLVLLVYLVLG